MASGIGRVQVKRSRGKLVVQGLGKTPRGQNYVKVVEQLDVKSTADPKFKGNLKAAIARMFAEQPSTQ